MTTRCLRIALVVSLAGAVPVAAENIDPANDGAQYAWAENVGWINAEPSGDGGPGAQVTDFELTGWMWAENVGWISLSCKNTSSCASAPYGVQNDGQGALSGYAWAENAGWINFAPSTAGVFIDPATGAFSGRAWGENVGWVSFASTGVFPFRMRTSWVCSASVPPGGSPNLLLTPAQSIVWTAAGGTGFDLVWGDLQVLRSTGSFATSFNGCLSNNTTDSQFHHSSIPAPGNGFWYLVRPLNCAGAGSYGSAQADLQIALAPNACP